MQAQAAQTGTWGQWWRIGGVAGIVFLVSFFVCIAISGETPMRDDSVQEIRAYFADDGQNFLIGDYLGGFAFVFFFLTFVVVLTNVLRSAEGTPSIFSSLSAIGGVLAVALGALGAIAFGTLAIGAAEHPEVDDSVVRALTEMAIYTQNLMAWGLALFVGAASLVILRTGAMWRLIGALGILITALLVIGTAWTIDGNEEGALGVAGIIGFMGTGVWVLVSSVNLLLMKEAPGQG